MKYPARLPSVRPLSALLASLLFAGLADPVEGRINVVSLPGRNSVQLTIYNSVDLTLVKERRTLAFRQGTNRLEFSWANTLIDPTSVEFQALTHADELEVQDVRFPPRVTNTLEWRIQSEFAGEVEVEIRYFTSGISWAADYVVEADSRERTLALAGSVRINNQSGEDYENAQVRLVVGQVRLVERIMDLSKSASKRRGLELEELKLKLPAPAFMGTPVNLPVSLAAVEKAKEIVKEAMSEYFLYTIEGRDTIPTGWARRLPSFKAGGVPLVSLYKYERERWGDQVVRFYRFRNSRESKLGHEPLPDGRVVAFRTVADDRSLALVGDTSVKYIPVDEQVDLELGPDQEVQVKPVLADWKKSDLKFDAAGNPAGWTITEKWSLEIQNSREIEVALDIRRTLPGDWSLQTEVPYEQLDAQKIKFTLSLKPREKKTVPYTVTTRCGMSATR
jgi:hypothetical protein